MSSSNAGYLHYVLIRRECPGLLFSPLVASVVQNLRALGTQSLGRGMRLEREWPSPMLGKLHDRGTGGPQSMGSQTVNWQVTNIHEHHFSQ